MSNEQAKPQISDKQAQMLQLLMSGDWWIHDSIKAQIEDIRRQLDEPNPTAKWPWD